MKEITQEEYTIWNDKFQKAQLVTHNREEEISKVNELIENDLKLIGSTAIEDRL